MCFLHVPWKTYLLFQKLEPDIPEYKAVNIKVKGYDFAVLEAYNKYIQNVAERMKLDYDG